jgi:hypothetical protein
MRIRHVIAIICLIGFGLVGLNNVTSWPGAHRAAQRLATAVAVGAGVLALASAVALWRRAVATRGLLLVWAASVTAAAGLAPWAWGDAPPRAWLTAGVVGALLALVVCTLAWSPRSP